jgi:hypothetical protein
MSSHLALGPVHFQYAFSRVPLGSDAQPAQGSLPSAWKLLVCWSANPRKKRPCGSEEEHLFLRLDMAETGGSQVNLMEVFGQKNVKATRSR